MLYFLFYSLWSCDVEATLRILKTTSGNTHRSMATLILIEFFQDINRFMAMTVFHLLFTLITGCLLLKEFITGIDFLCQLHSAVDARLVRITSNLRQMDKDPFMLSPN